MTDRLPKFFSVPPGTPSAQCRGATCNKRIYWVTNPETGRMLPVDCDCEGGEAPSDTNDPAQLDAFTGRASVHPGRGVSHFTTCSDAAQFTRGGQR